MKWRVVHEICDGRSGMGKTQFQRTRLHSLLRMRERPAVFVFDSKGSLSKAVLIDLQRDGLLRDVLVEDFDTTRSLGYTFLRTSTAADPTTRRIENRQSIEQTKAKILSPRGLLNDLGNPNIRDALDAAFGCYASLQPPAPFCWCHSALLPRSDGQHYFLEHATEDEPRRRLEFFSYLSSSQWEYRCGAADRILRDICGDPVIQQRDGGTFDARQFINRRGVYLGIGNSNVSRLSQTFLFNSLLIDIFDAARKGLDHGCVVVAEEAQAGGIITPALAKAALEMRELGVELRLSTQNIFALAR